MRSTRFFVVTITTAGLIGTVWAAARNEVATDALRPENDVVAQLEQRIARLEARVADLEQRSPGYLTVPATHWMPTPRVSPAWPAPAYPPPPQSDPDERETNGVKFKLYLLGSESAPTRR